MKNYLVAISLKSISGKFVRESIYMFTSLVDEKTMHETSGWMTDLYVT